MFVPATPNSQLQKKYQKQIGRQGFKIKVVEKAGIAIKRLLQKSDHSEHTILLSRERVNKGTKG